ncbi:hypothetical protein SAMN05216410_0846 [Sanguibacter gelidistatuariae]|uniref:Uncharacterized protein n=1 Tax=Sanguibacter gelidistatuariae TaxID=1814289 RepID=A0A1G6H9F8_9MICO|nr:hypothetical protein [Sanguibacter gelidistatuariae]SDB90784.1 hypothetical protein SAMN05216410_0846 [Sanguibacter gelidistatuariae]
MSDDQSIDDHSITLTVTGGAGGQAANTADIATAAGLIAAAAAHLADARRRCAEVSAIVLAGYLQHCFDFSPTRDPVRGIYLKGAADAAQLLGSALLAQEHRLLSLDRRTRTAGQVLDDAEQSVMSGMWNAARTVDGWDLSPLAFGRTVVVGGMSVPGGSFQERFVAGIGAGIGKYNPSRNFLRPPGIADGAVVLARHASFYSGWTWPSTTLHLPGAQPEPPRDLRPGHLTERRVMAAPVTSVTGATAEINSLPAETIEIQKIPHDDGSVTWGVYIRGMDDLTIGSNSPFSLENNLVLAQGERSTGMDLVESAMQQAGIPVGAAVGLYGHSEGGTVAVSLAGDPTFRRRYDVRNVATFGSPTAGITLNPPVPMLSVQNQDEVISSLAGAAPPDSPERVTIAADLPGGPDLPGIPGPERAHSAHSLTTHGEVLDLALARGVPGVAEAVEQQSAVLGDAGVVVMPAGTPEAGRTVVTPPATVETMYFSPGPVLGTGPGAGLGMGAAAASPLPSVSGEVCLPGSGSPVVGPTLVTPTPPTLPDGSLDWEEMSRRAGAITQPLS